MKWREVRGSKGCKEQIRTVKGSVISKVVNGRKGQGSWRNMKEAQGRAEQRRPERKISSQLH